MRNLKNKIILSLLWLVVWISFNKIMQGLNLVSSRDILSLSVEGLFCILIAQVMCSSKSIRYLVLGMLTILLLCQFNIVSLLSYFINIALFWLTWKLGPIKVKTKMKSNKKIKLAKGHVLR